MLCPWCARTLFPNGEHIGACLPFPPSHPNWARVDEMVEGDGDVTVYPPPVRCKQRGTG